MTDKLKTAIKELEKLPEREQDSWATAILEDLHARQEREEGRSQVEPFASFRFLRDAKVSLPADASVTYERDLYGREDALDA